MRMKPGGQAAGSTGWLPCLPDKPLGDGDQGGKEKHDLDQPFPCVQHLILQAERGRSTWRGAILSDTHGAVAARMSPIAAARASPAKHRIVGTQQDAAPAGEMAIQLKRFKCDSFVGVSKSFQNLQCFVLGFCNR